MKIIDGTKQSRANLIAAFGYRPNPEPSREEKLAKIERNYRMGAISEAERKAQIESLG